MLKLRPDSSAIVSILPDLESWTWRTGDTAPWPGGGVAKSAATRAPPWTARTAACPPRSPTAPARPWRPTTTTAGCTTGTASQTSFTESQTSSPDKVCAAAPTDLPSDALNAHCCTWLMTKVGGNWEQSIVPASVPLELSLRTAPFIHPHQTSKLLLWSWTQNSLTVWWLLSETRHGGFDTRYLQQILGSIRGIPLESWYFRFFGKENIFLPSTNTWHSLHVQYPLGISLSPVRGCCHCMDT